MDKLPFRQIHLDFHTSEKIPSIGDSFNKQEFQDTLKEACVNSVTCFATCHHGLAYYDTKFDNKHPHLKTNLLKKQFEACKEIGINVCIYLTAGVNNWEAEKHPEWREINATGKYSGWVQSLDTPGFKSMCFNTPYLDLICEQIKEVATLFPDNNGIFLDIINQEPCCCKWCIASMTEKGLDFTEPKDREQNAKEVLLAYYQKTTSALREISKEIPIFHNSGNIQKGNTDILKYFSHLELESLPTGGWGYDHFPLSAKYVANLPFEVIGMTGKFHTTWGEFGGFKHPNALKYECAAMLAFSSKCSVGDQLHPNAKLDKSTYNIIGQAYHEVKTKEPWCDGVTQVSDVSILSSASFSSKKESPTDEGVARILLEGHIPFDLIDKDMDFSKAKLIILPDDIPVNEKLKEKLNHYLNAGGKLMITGDSGLDQEGKPLFDIGGSLGEKSPFNPDYILPTKEIRPDYLETPFVMYARGRRFKADLGTSLGDVYDPYFNREKNNFSSHQHTPFVPTPTGYHFGSQNKNILFFAYPVFTMYRSVGNVLLKEILLKAIRNFLGNDLSLKTNLPSSARISIMKQADKSRTVLHLLYANKILRGGPINMSGGNLSKDGRSIEVIEDLQSLHNTEVAINFSQQIHSVRLEPQGQEVPFEKIGKEIKFKINEFTCHQMIVFS